MENLTTRLINHLKTGSDEYARFSARVLNNMGDDGLREEVIKGTVDLVNHATRTLRIISQNSAEIMELFDHIMEQSRLVMKAF